MIVPVVTMLMIGAYTAAAFVVAWRFLSKWARAAFVTGTVFIFALALLYFFIPHSPWYTEELFHRFDVQGEYNFVVGLTITFELSLTVVAFALALFARGEHPWWHRLYWVWVGCTFIYTAVDEYYTLHLFGLPIVLVILGAGALVFGVITWFFAYNRTFTMPLILFIGGIGVSAAGAFAVEDVFYSGLCDYANAPLCQGLPAFEEIMEMSGALLSAVAVITVAEHLLSRRWRTGALLVAGVCGAIAILVSWTAIHEAIRPSLVFTYADPLSITVESGDVRFYGVNIDLKPAAPTGEADTGEASSADGASDRVLDVTLYYLIPRGSEFSYNFGFSVHLLSGVDETSVASEDYMGRPSAQREKGILQESHVLIELDDTIPTGHYDVAMTMFWKEGPWFEDGEIVFDPVLESDRAVISDYTVILDQVTLIHEAEPVPASAESYIFANGLTLDGYQVGEMVGDQLPLRFWWTATQPQAIAYVQLLHLYQGDDYLIFDDQPFQGRFPATDWPQDVLLDDQWTLTLPPDATGEWEIYLGLYDPETYDRVAVTDSAGNPQPDQLIHIGSITLE